MIDIIVGPRLHDGIYTQIQMACMLYREKFSMEIAEQLYAQMVGLDD